MQLEPVRRECRPRYPTSLEDRPDLLEILPERWRGNPLVARVLGGAVALLLASGARAAEPASPPKVAPVFVHGEGRGGFGCVAVNPPVFLSEAEARQVIQDEARRAGLEFAEDGLSVTGVNLPATNPYGYRDPQKVPQPTQPGTLVLDGYDRKRNIAYEFVSSQDFNSWEMETTYVSTAFYLDLRETADTLQRGLAAKPPAWTAVFYEPGAQAPLKRRRDWFRPGNDSEKQREALHQAGMEDLRKQVRDFISWLKAQGVI